MQLSRDRAEVCALDRAARDPAAACAGAVWRRLLEGRWTLLDHFIVGERRYLVTRPTERPCTRLTQRERYIVDYVVQGWSNKAIAAALRIAEGTVACHVSRTVRKLGLPSRMVLAELHARLGQPGGGAVHRLRVCRWRVGTEERLVVGLQVLTVAPEELTRAEREVCRMLLSGLSNREIARARGCSERTIANQCWRPCRGVGV